MKKIDTVMPPYVLFEERRDQVRIKSAMDAIGIHTIADLCKMSVEDSMNIKGIGKKKTYQALLARMRAADLRFGMDDAALRNYACEAICDRIVEERQALIDEKNGNQVDQQCFHNQVCKALERATKRLDEAFTPLEQNPPEDVTFGDVRDVAKKSFGIALDFLKDIFAPNTIDCSYYRDGFVY